MDVAWLQRLMAKDLGKGEDHRPDVSRLEGHCSNAASSCGL